MDQELRELERRLLEDGHGALVRWVRGLVAASKDEGLDDPPLWATVSVQPYGVARVDVHVPAHEGFRNYFDWTGLSVVPSTYSTEDDLERWSLTCVRSINRLTGRVIEFPLALALSASVGFLSGENAGEPMIQFRPIRLYATQGVCFEFHSPSENELSLMVVAFVRRGGEW